MKVQQCMCNVRRNTKNMAKQSKCVQKTSTGACSKSAVGKSTRCNDHTCQHAGCPTGKSSKVRFCNKHEGKKQSNLLNQKTSTVQMNPAFMQQSAGAGGGGVGGGGAGGAGGAAAFIPATYDLGEVSNSSVTYATPFERSNDAVYAEAEQGQSLA